MDNRKPNENGRDAYISVILKVTERCNLACPYCYFFFAGDESYKQHPALIGDATVAQLIKFIQDAKQKTGLSRVRIGIHGGEPLLLGKKRFSQLCSELRTALGEEPELTLALQTNGTLIDNDWIAIFAEQRVRIGVSIDGPEHIHNTMRITKRGKGTFQETAVGWHLLRDAARRGYISEPSVLCVVTPSASGKEIFEYFAGQLDVKSMNFLLLDETHDTVKLKPGLVDNCARFLIEIIDAWSSAEQQDIHVRFIDEMVGPLINDELYLRKKDRPNPLLQLSVSSNGDLCPDDVIRSFSTEFAATDLNVATSSYCDVESNIAWTQLRVAQQDLPSVCTNCTWKDVCGGGLLQHRYSKKNGFANPSVYCAALKKMHAHVSALLINSGYSAANIEDRLMRLSN